MRLRKDCIRDLLLYFEKELTYDKRVRADYITFDEYTKEEIIYTCDKLLEAGMINAKKCNNFANNYPVITIESITPSGHKLIDNIKDPEIWSETKNKLKVLKDVSIDIISQVAATIITTRLGI